MFEVFKNWEKQRHTYAQEWKKKTGGKVLGYFCTYVPEEILYAAGVLPVRILGSHEPTDLTEPHIFGGMFCPFSRDCLAQGLKGRYDYLDGIMIAQSCLHIRQAFSSWQKHIPQEFSYYLCMPNNVQSGRAESFLAGEILEFKKAVEKWTGKEIKEESLSRSIETYNQSRRLLHQVYSTRKQENPPLTGEEAMEMVISNQMTDKSEHNQALGDLVKNLEGRKMNRQTGTRLMLIGSENDDIPFIHMLESLNATVVIDEHCTGTRYFWNEVVSQHDLIKAIAKRYIDRPPCPSKDWEVRRRVQHTLSLAKEYQVSGAILIQQKFCDPHELDIPAISKALEENGIRTLFLEFDVTVPIGQFKTRCEAFLEILQQEEELF